MPDKRFRRTAGTIDGDEGVRPSTREGLARLKPVQEDGTVTFGGQTHPADGNAGVILATPDKARDLSKDPSVNIAVLGFGMARTKPHYMPAAPVPAAQKALDMAGLTIGDIDAVKTHNPFAVNDVVFARETGFDVDAMNNYGCSLIFGHPNGPTGLRLTIELVEELVQRGGGAGPVYRLRGRRQRDGGRRGGIAGPMNDARPIPDADPSTGWTKDWPYTPLRLPERALEIERRSNGETILRNPTPLEPYPVQVSDDLRRQAARIPDRTFLAQRDADGAWVHLTYATARDRADRVSQWLLDNGHNGDNPVAILSDNSLNFAALQLGAMQVGIPAMPVSPAYSLMSKDFAKVRHVCDSFTPSLIYVEDAALFRPALEAVKPAATIVATRNVEAIAGAIPFDDLLAGTPGEAVERGLRGGDGRQYRQDPADLGQHRPAQGRHQHPAADVFVADPDRPGLAVPARRAAGDLRLAALEPHLCGELQLQHHPALRRHLLARRGQAGAGAGSTRPCATCAR